MAMVLIKRAYSNSSPRDGTRILVDRIWPRGITKARARIAEWRKDLAPTTALRKWFGHDRTRWNEFCRRYRRELKQSMVELEKLARLSCKRTITLVYGAADQEHNQAVVLKDLIDELAVKLSGKQEIGHESRHK
ncbi:MAG TPA: DUF488 family protein [Nitrospira sp.]|nr:DUF488 family protein [Nitrospira sp.]